MYGADGGYLKWLLYSVYMLLGAITGMKVKNIKINPLNDLVKLFLSIILFYTLYVIPRKVYAVEYLQIFNFIPLFGVVYYFYKVCASEWIRRLYEKRIIYYIVRFVGGLCLEIYLIQSYIFTDKLNDIFPLNLVIIFFIIVIAAYITRIIARLFSQTFKDDPYHWKEIINWK